MTFKELTAAVQVLSVVVIGGWVINQATSNAELAGSVQAVATMLCWAIGASIVFNIAATIVGAILVSIAQGQEIKDERADERDRLVGAKAMGNAYVVTSIVAALALLALAFGTDPLLAIYGLFAAPMLGGLVEASSRLVYYRVG